MRICDAALCRYRRSADFFSEKPHLLRATRSLADLNYADDGGTKVAVVLPRGWVRAAIVRSFVLASISNPVVLASMSVCPSPIAS